MLWRVIGWMDIMKDIYAMEKIPFYLQPKANDFKQNWRE